MSISSQMLEVKELHIHTLTAGENGSPVILLHGGGTDSASLSWRLALPLLGEHFRVFAPDLPGFGTSDKPDIVYSTDTYIQFLADFMDALGIQKATLAGISMGGGISLGFALAHPQRVERLVLVDSYGIQPSAPMHKLSYLYIRLPWINELSWKLVKGNRSMARMSLKSMFHDPAAATDELVEEVLTELSLPGAGKAWISYQKNDILWNGTRTYYLDRLNEIQVPALFIHGENDPLVPLECARKAQERIQGSTLQVIPGCGHWSQREKPEEFNRILMQYLVS